MRKKGGQRLMEMGRRKSPPVFTAVTPPTAVEETTPRYTDSDRFDQPIMHDVGPIDEELPPAPPASAPPAPARRDLIGKMFPRLSAAVNLFGQIDVSGLKQKRGEVGMKKFDESVGTRLMDDALLGQLSDLENRLSLDILPKNLPQIKRRLDERHLESVLTPIDEKKATQAILKRLQANRTKSTDPEVRKAEKLAEIEAKDEETLAELAQIQIPILAFNDAELESLFPKVGLEVPSGDDITIMEQLVAAYEESSGFKRTVFQAWVVIHHPEMDQEFFDWMPAGAEEE